MATRSRFRRIAKWVGLAVIAVLLSAWLVSMAKPAAYYAPGVGFAASAGGWISFGFDPRSISLKPGWNFDIEARSALSWPPIDGGRIPIAWILVAYWLLILLALASTLLFWFLDRRRPGHCHSCGYNLTGNQSGVCPERTTPVPKPEATV